MRRKQRNERRSQYITATVVCRICSREHVAVWPSDIADEDAQECPYCGHMTCEPIEDEEA
jgi:DNA-directed RNA polymerase subunit RPC12/RpoP